MSLIDSASLIVTPNGYKEGKLYSVIPSDGSGDMSVVRATTATRVNSAGLVELVPYNLLSYSEQFDNAAWSKTAISVSANSATAPNGLNTADTLSNTSASAIILQTSPSVNTSTVVTHSVYLKRTNNDWVVVAIARNGATTYGELYVWFNIATGVVGSNLPDGVAVLVDADIEDAGNGWYRCSVTGYVPNAVSYVAFMFFPDANSSFNRVTSQSVYIWGAQLVEGSTAKDYQKTETRLNIPRLDYSNGTCPSLLVEPQRTNLLISSNSLIGVSGTTATANDGVSPMGITNAILISGIGGYAYTGASNTLGNGNTTTFSCFIKYKQGLGKASIGLGGPTFNSYVYVDGLSTGNLVLTNSFGSGITNGSSTYEDYGNGWYRIIVTATYTGTPNYQEWQIAPQTTNTHFWYFGGQIENGAYPTSYIPTTSASVTRNADVISKTGISSLIGQTEGVCFVDFIHNGADITTFQAALFVSSGDPSNLINIGVYDGRLNPAITASSVGIFDVYVGPNPLPQGRHKVAIAYKSGDFAIYLNGTQVYTNTNSATFGTMSQVDLGTILSLGRQLGDGIKAAALWKTRLTNDELERLTGTGFNTYAEMANYYNYITQ